MILEKINKPNDIKQLSPIEYNQLADEIRRFLIEKISKTGGHLASNLGVVELTMALHLAFNLPQDKLIWDVGHQSYTHKILTGRKNQFDQLRKFGGMSGFPKRNESHFDAFDTGHSSTSISAGLGLVKARDLKNEHYSVVSVIGDGALTGGMAYEALNNASSLKTNFIIVLILTLPHYSELQMPCRQSALRPRSQIRPYNPRPRSLWHVHSLIRQKSRWNCVPYQSSHSRFLFVSGNRSSRHICGVYQSFLFFRLTVYVCRTDDQHPRSVCPLADPKTDEAPW